MAISPVNLALARVLTRPEAWPADDLPAVDRLLRQAARGAVIGTLAARLGDGVANQPPAVRDRLRAAQVVAVEHERRLRFALRLAGQVLGASDMPVVVLKGGSYLLAGFANAAGRLTSDLDLLVPEGRLAEAEQRFLAAGWVSGDEDQDDYDQQYYRRWMHELPPLRHPHHGITLDLHHNITPRTARLRVDADALLTRAVPLGADTPFLRLADEDLVLHLCIHLFHDGEFHHGLRELLDLDGVLRGCMRDPDAWARLLARADALGMSRPLYYGCHFAAQLLDTPVPTAVQSELLAKAGSGPGMRLARVAMASCLLPVAGDGPTPARRLAELALFLRAHWLRMPLPLLLRHLATQAWRRGGLKTKPAH